MTIHQYIEKHGKRNTAIKLVSDRIYIYCGLTTDELPDTLELCNLYDEIESLLSDWEKNKESIYEHLNEINLEYIESVLLT